MSPTVTASAAAGFVRVGGLFYRAVDSRFEAAALHGSRGAGRYSPPGLPALYLSASPEGVEAAMVAHRIAASPPRTLLTLSVAGAGILDLRDPAACAAAGIDPAGAAAPWQEIAAAGGQPPSWQVAERLRAAGANGLIDPSRKAPGLWHLVLFRWNEAGAPSVRLA